MTSSAYNPEPNRYAGQQEATILRAQITAYQEDLRVANLRVEESETRLHAATATVLAAELTLRQAREAQQAAGAGHVCAVQRVQSIQRSITECKAPLNPLRKTPLEILGLIFDELADQEHRGLSLTGHKRLQKVPFILSAVCRRWREAVHNSTRLWCRVVIEFSSKTTSLPQKVLAWQAFLATHIQRSGSRLLDLTIFHDETHVCSNSSQLYRSLHAMVVRAATVDITFNSECCDKFLTFLKARTPKLQRARIATFFPPPPTPPQAFEFFQTAHSLKYLHLHHCIPKWKSGCLHSVTEIKATWTVVPVSELIEMFGMMPALEAVTIDTASILDTEGVIRSSRLRRFDLSVDVITEHFASNKLHFPALDSLTLRYPRYSPHLPQRNFPTARRLALMACLGTSPNIKYLRVDATKCDERFAGVLEQFAALETFEARNAWVSPTFFARMTAPRPSGELVCPALHTIIFDTPFFQREFDQDTFLGFVRSRKESAGAKRVNVQIRLVGDTNRPSWLEELAELQQA
ncbi:hypothetical protein EXIGLDRAFT_723345 [Exidia glandulosa HHB12029]|uniref:Uncharacterized protein n=1 Tax=Exidia glandulosa HHB12029 TaxID=1314781 RepID=A0A165EVX6_EXIGL|nr:hypothetical protein EXIGLDRAFT_723345 [Exidia glandulosa HHB12029]